MRALDGNAQIVFAIDEDGNFGRHLLCGCEHAARLLTGLRRRHLRGGNLLGERRSDDDAVKNFLRGLHVALQHHGRNVERFPVRIKAGPARFVGWERIGHREFQAKDISYRVVIFPAIETAGRNGASEWAGAAGGVAQAIVDPGGKVQPFVLSELRGGRRHGAIAELRCDRAPHASLLFHVIGGLRFEEIDAGFGVGWVVAGGAVLFESRADGLRELGGRGFGGD